MSADLATNERLVSANITAIVASLPVSVVRELEDRIRALCDEYAGVDVQATLGKPRPV